MMTLIINIAVTATYLKCKPHENVFHSETQAMGKIALLLCKLATCFHCAAAKKFQSVLSMSHCNYNSQKKCDVSVCLL